MHQSMIDSPDRTLELRPRALTFGHSPENSHDSSFEGPKINASPTKRSAPSSSSPPYRKIQSLRLFDTPSTPNTIIKKSAFGKTKAPQNHFLKNIFNQGFDEGFERPTSHQVHNKFLEMVSTRANVNPFTPDSQRKKNKKRSRSEALQENMTNLLTDKDNRRRQVASFFTNYTDMDDDVDENAPKRLALEETNISRYRREFVEQSLIGAGEFGQVYRCLNRLDGCTYAIKKSIKPVAGSNFEKTALNEVWAHAVLGKHDNVVRYYSAWAENNHMLIQNEYCNGGSLQTVLETRCLDESDLRILLTHISGGLKYIHSHGLCHMDIKSGNIFLSKVPKRTVCSNNLNIEDVQDFEEFDNDDGDDFLVIYKIGDLGHVTSARDPQVEEGDCRYLPKEVLNDDFSQLFKADMFALGMTLYEAGGGGPLPKNGEKWHKLRNGEVPDLPCLTKDFNNLIKQLMHPDPFKRPSSTNIFRHSVLRSSETKSKSQMTRELMIKSKSELRHELIMERERNDILTKQLRTYEMALLKSTDSTHTPKNLKRTTPIATDRRLRSYSKISRSGKSSVKTNSNIRDQNKNIFGSFLR